MNLYTSATAAPQVHFFYDMLIGNESIHVALSLPFVLFANMSKFYRTADDGIKMASLSSIPDVHDVATMNKMTSAELNRLVTTEPQPAEGSLGHLLPLIFTSFKVDVPESHTLKIRLDKIIHRNKRINDNFSQNAPEDFVPLYDTQAGLWNWALPTSPPQSSGNLADDDGLPQASAKKVTHETYLLSQLQQIRGDAVNIVDLRLIIGREPHAILKRR